MHNSRHLAFFLIFTAVLLFGTVGPVFAGAIEYPTDSPAITFEIPSDWESSDVGSSDTKPLIFLGPDDEIHVQLDMHLRGSFDLPIFVQNLLKGTGMSNVEVTKSGDAKIAGDILAKCVTVSYKDPYKDSSDSSVGLFISFPTSGDKICVIHFLMKSQHVKKYRAQIDKTINSIKMVK